MFPETAQSWVEDASGNQSLSTDCPDLGLIPDQYMWDLWWEKRHWERFPSQYIGFPRQYPSTDAPYSSSSICHQQYIILATEEDVAVRHTNGYGQKMWKI
jgi:hypothetical protein